MCREIPMLIEVRYTMTVPLVLVINLLGIGLYNQKNWCYINSLVQLLAKIYTYTALFDSVTPTPNYSKYFEPLQCLLHCVLGPPIANAQWEKLVMDAIPFDHGDGQRDSNDLFLDLTNEKRSLLNDKFFTFIHSVSYTCLEVCPSFRRSLAEISLQA